MKNPVAQSLSLLENILCGEDFLEDRLSEEAQEAVWQQLENVHIDARRRQLIWPDGQRLTFNASSQRLRKKLTEFSRDEIEDHIIAWIEMGCEPQGFSEEQMEKFENLTGKWADTLTQRLHARTEKRARTRDS